MLRGARGDLLCTRLTALDAQLWLVDTRVSSGGSKNLGEIRLLQLGQAQFTHPLVVGALKSIEESCQLR
jgi:hypothetical protein